MVFFCLSAFFIITACSDDDDNIVEIPLINFTPTDTIYLKSTKLNDLKLLITADSLAINWGDNDKFDIYGESKDIYYIKHYSDTNEHTITIYAKKLVTLGCHRNNITALNLKKAPSLSDLKCSMNNLTELDLSNNPNLHTIHCGDNKLTKLDVFDKPYLQILGCNVNELAELNTKNTLIYGGFPVIIIN